MSRAKITSAGAIHLATRDSFENTIAQLGIGSPNGPQNLLAAGSYNYNPITHNRMLLEYAYRGSWIVRKVVDCPAEDMTREGIAIDSEAPPDVIEGMHQFWEEWGIWQALHEGISWGRLYGGAIVVMLIDGQDPAMPLQPQTVGVGQFKGLMVLDRWMVQPTLSDLVTELGPDLGKPRFYDVYASSPDKPAGRIHHTRCIRFEGDPLPYWQRQAENLWTASVIEAPYDRFLAYDSTTLGAAQLVFKAHLRTLKMERLRELIAAGEGGAYDAMMQQMNFINFMQSFNGITLLDASDEMETTQYSFSGLSDLMLQFGQQLSGAGGVPMVRMFGQSPTGMNSTGESDLRNYYDHCKAQQMRTMKRGVAKIVDVTARSLTGQSLPAGSQFSFRPMWQLTDEQKGTVSGAITDQVAKMFESGLISAQVALRELRQASRTTGIWTKITDEDIASADDKPPEPPPAPAPGFGGGGDVDQPPGSPEDVGAGGGKGPDGGNPPGQPKNPAQQALGASLPADVA